MKENNDILEIIERYTKDKMSVDEKVAFEKELVSDEFLREQFQFSQIVDQMIIGNEAWKLKEQMTRDLYKPKSGIWSYLAISFFVVVSSVSLFVVFNKREDKKPIAISKIVVPKTFKQAEIKKTETAIVTKTKKVKEVRRNTSISSASPELKVASVQNLEPQKISVQSEVQSASPVNTVKELSQTVVAKVDPCVGLLGDVEFYTLASCKGQETGEIHLKAESIKGGKSPFSFKIGERSAEKYFDRLASGQYTLFIQDANNCLVENAKKVVVSEKKCVVKKEYVFNPEYDSSWPIPYDSDKQATSIKIHEKSGKAFYQSSVSASQPAEWRGESNTGLVLGMGLYFFTIEYADGSLDEGSIVISR
jgi:hypothetical protein